MTRIIRPATLIDNRRDAENAEKYSYIEKVKKIILSFPRKRESMNTMLNYFLLGSSNLQYLLIIVIVCVNGSPLPRG
jgi:hypothetical protein